MAKQMSELRPSKRVTGGESNEFPRNHKIYDANLKNNVIFDPMKERLIFEIGKELKSLWKESEFCQKKRNKLNNRLIKV